MSLTPSDLAAYLARIGYDGPRDASLTALSGIVAAHATTIPFESLDVLLDRPPRLDAASLVDKLVRRRRGGYCFEHNTLLWQALDALGFDAHGLGGRVVWNRPAELPTGPRTHMLLRVALPEGDFLADVGFGGLTLTSPLRLAVGPEQATTHEPHRLVEAGDEIELQVRLGTEWTRLYHFSLQPQVAVDYEVANWYTATYPDSIFRHNLMGARPTPDRRYALLNRNFTVRYRDGRTERRELVDADDFGRVLRHDFHVELPPEDVQLVWQRLGS
ncbi:MAG: arylamine N-acetyltransferase [Alphaproteobacteria bacterium]|nr:arylamine N-acetyltransferase [Alphaproteobacteria bacterium]